MATILMCARPAAASMAHIRPRTRPLQSTPLPEQHIPLIDLAHLTLSSRHAAHAKEALAAACKEWGFFQVINHGVSSELIQKFRKQSLDLFALPLEQKEQVSRRQGSLWGYQLRANAGPLEVFQVCGWDDATIADYANKLFPNSSEHFCAVYKETNTVFRKLAMEILDLVIEGLGVDTEQFAVHKKEGQGVLRANYYHQSGSGDQVLGLVAHVDGNLFTILHQEDVSGLEVLNNGRWVPVAPQKEALCINVADILQVLTNGQFKSVQHRAVAPKSQARLSFAYFLTPAESVPLVPALELVDSEHPLLYRPFTWADFVEAQTGPSRPYPSVLPSFFQRHPNSSHPQACP